MEEKRRRRAPTAEQLEPLLRHVARLDEQRGLTDEVMAQRREQDAAEETAKRAADDRLQNRLEAQQQRKYAASRRKRAKALAM